MTNPLPPGTSIRIIADALGNEFEETITKGSYTLRQTKFAKPPAKNLSDLGDVQLPVDRLGNVVLRWDAALGKWASPDAGLTSAEVPTIVAEKLGDRLVPTGGTSGQTLSKTATGTLEWKAASGGGGSTTGKVTAYDGPSRKATVSYVDSAGVTVTVADCPNASAYQLSVGDVVALSLRSGGASPLITGRIAVSNTYTPPAYAPLNTTSGYPFDQTSVTSTHRITSWVAEDTANILGLGAGVLVGYNNGTGSTTPVWINRAAGTSGTLPVCPVSLHTIRFHDGKMWAWGIFSTAAPSYFNVATQAWVTPAMPAIRVNNGNVVSGTQFSVFFGADGGLRFARLSTNAETILYIERWDIPTQAWVREYESPSAGSLGAVGTACVTWVIGDHVWVRYQSTAPAYGLLYFNKATNVAKVILTPENTVPASDRNARILEGAPSGDGTKFLIPGRAADSWLPASRLWCSVFDNAGGSVVSQWQPGVAVANGIQNVGAWCSVGLGTSQWLIAGVSRDAENDGVFSVVWSTDGVTTARVWTGTLDGRTLFPITIVDDAQPQLLLVVEPGRYRFHTAGGGTVPIIHDVVL